MICRDGKKRTFRQKAKRGRKRAAVAPEEEIPSKGVKSDPRVSHSTTNKSGEVADVTRRHSARAAPARPAAGHRRRRRRDAGQEAPRAEASTLRLQHDRGASPPVYRACGEFARCRVLFWAVDAPAKEKRENNRLVNFTSGVDVVIIFFR
ncbi:hypothetical protein EVAR_21498_1 [Eumeta japonica]|uniref:Uncharacterized protein n=1 Tax=Eumeta variegata TaxID=151549 RepID=A0A4C1UXN0_EUMVA|nr:hypothetical protein EVAR_21498_1 [Eumeta japonica]